MFCPHCRQTTTAVAGRCGVCNKELANRPVVATGVLTPIPPGGSPDEVTNIGPLPGDVDVTKLPTPVPGITLPVSPTPQPPVPRSHSGQTPAGTGGVIRSAGTSGPLAPGEAFGPRYHIIRLLGVGGMGAVYQAWDDELGVSVAIKIVRPEVTADPALAAELERRFKRELLLAREVTHKNVVRIHDLGEINGIKYITMPYIQGRDLATILRTSGKLPVANVLRIVKQVAAGLQAAHEAGVIHRDLKPANIMVDDDEQACIMDFGIARSAAGGGGTMLGAVVGTVDYMAPEQARGENVDRRADIYAFGLIVYDLLGGRRTGGRSSSVVTELMARMQNAPTPLTTIDAQIPEALDRIVERCLQPKAEARYQTMAELLADLNSLDADGHPIAGRAVIRSRTTRIGSLSVPAASWKWAAAAALLIAVAGGGYLLRDRVGGSASPAPVAGQPVSLAILPFRNASGDPSLDWLGTSVAEMLRTELGQSARFRTVPPERVAQILRDLRIPSDSTFDPAALRQLAEFGNADSVLWGQYVTFGNEIRIDATLENVKQQRPAVPLKAQAGNQGALMTAITQLASAVHAGLALPDDIVEELEGKSLRPSTASVMALRHYNEGVQLARLGKHQEAVKSFETATTEDGNFALAFSRLGQTYALLGYGNEAERFSRKAVELSEALPPHEKYTILATHSRVVNDTKKAIEAYENLAAASPEDTQVHLALAELYEGAGDFTRARDNLAKVLEHDPKYVDALIAMGRVETRRGSAQASLEPLNQALSLAVAVDNDEARARILQAIGISYKRLNKPADALRNYEDSLAIKRRLGQKGGMASSLSEIAQMQMQLGRPAEAEKAYSEGLQLRREIGDKRGTADILLNLGSFHAELARYDRALTYFREALQIQREIGNEVYQALCLNNIGFVYLSTGQYEDALTYFDRALQLREKLGVPREAAETVHNLALTWSRMGRYDDALKQHLRALELWRSAGDKRSAALESFALASVFEYQGRFGAALKAKEEALNTLTAMQVQGVELVDVRSGYGSILSQVGRFSDADRALTEALSRARELAHKGLIAQTLVFLGDNALYQGDYKTATARYAEAQPLAAATKDRHLLLLVQASQATVGMREGRAQAALPVLRSVAAEAETLGLRYLSVNSSLSAAEALLELKQAAAARTEVQRALGNAERFGLRLPTARAYSLLGTAYKTSGAADEGARHQERARRLVTEIRNELGSNDLYKRADLKTLQ
jgi:tetratricopeptide (TPR) repeat protein/tRNA A-37 threonylcarbamoyl transferase component Bud32